MSSNNLEQSRSSDERFLSGPRHSSLDQEAGVDYTETEGSKNSQKKRETIEIAHQESRQVDSMRCVLFFVLLLTAIFVSTIVFLTARQSEEEDFEEAYRDMANKLVDTFRASSKRRLAAVESMALTITSSAAAGSWPNVTLPDWERRATYTMDLSDLMCLFFVPIVTGENRKGWEAFATANQGWINESLQAQGDIDDGQLDEQESIDLLEASWGTSPNGTIPAEINAISGTGVQVATGDGPFAPTWLVAPMGPVRNVINYDTLSHPTRRIAVKAMMEHPTNMVTEAWDYADTSDPTTLGKKAALNLFLNRRKNIRQSYQDGPVSDLYVPVFETTEHAKCPDHLHAPCLLAGYLTGYVYWQAFLFNILPPNSKEVIVILSNTCGQNYTYAVHGPDAAYLGPGDLHDTQYDYLEVTTGLHAFLNGNGDALDLMEGQCLYKVQVYPSQQMEDHYSTSDPWVLTGVILSTFLVTSFMFVLYDCLIQRRQRIVHNQAVKSTAVLHELFPAPVRDRIEVRDKEATQSTDFSQSGIIADLYPAATVLFADLAGFTAWSDNREPKEVFLLLESLYSAFDSIAKRRVVFKIETIGDCYLAVTGVPRPQKKHAVIMARFATECVAKMDHLIKTKLVKLLGEETANLKLRVGIHSGPVTAGVLRGERARYQLFGDTVNTAARMESNGVPGKIQVSESTAISLTEAGKSGWLTEREGGVDAKGKGKLRSWWVEAARLESHDSAGPTGESKRIPLDQQAATAA